MQPWKHIALSISYGFIEKQQKNKTRTINNMILCVTNGVEFEAER